MKLNELKPAVGATHRPKRVGRGDGSGHGGTSCKGHKGQKARAGVSIPSWFEGGQTPITRRIPTRGFNNIFRKEYAILNVDALNRFEDGTTVTSELLKELGVVKELKSGLKILGGGELSKRLVVCASQFSRSAKEKIENAGGRAELHEM